MPQSLLTGQLKEKPTYRVRSLYSSFVHVGVPAVAGILAVFNIRAIVVGVFAVAGIPAIDGVLKNL